MLPEKSSAASAALFKESSPIPNSLLSSANSLLAASIIRAIPPTFPLTFPVNIKIIPSSISVSLKCLFTFSSAVPKVSKAVAKTSPVCLPNSFISLSFCIKKS
tara:strand:- start:170 stop:478 length:309 start_codon:yes stop_codon:yes gene_type:complete